MPVWVCFRSDYVEDFKDFLDERDIMWHMYPLDNITDNAAMRKVGTSLN